jgi:copper chaperone CopZ
VKVDLASGRVEVQSSAPADSIKAAIEAAGYEVGTPA